jgi:DNA polymerase-3 subunit epsilon
LRLAIGHCGKRDKPLLTFKTNSDATTNALQKIKKYGLCLKLCNIIHSASSCHYNETEETGHFCPVCKEHQSPEEYNAKFTSAFLTNSNDSTFVIKTSGKTREDEGFIWVEKGKFLGFGYVPRSQAIDRIEEIKEYIQPCYDTQDSQTIIETHLKKAKLLMKEPVTVYSYN